MKFLFVIYSKEAHPDRAIRQWPKCRTISGISSFSWVKLVMAYQGHIIKSLK